MMAPLFLVLLAASPVFAVPEDKDLVQYRDYEYADRIIGGAPADIEEFPFIVTLLLEFNKSAFVHNCGGTIITEDWVLTAAHCVDPSLEEVMIPIEQMAQLTVLRAGSIFTDRRGITRRCAEIVLHDFPPHDVALVKVGEPWPFNRITISPARLPRQDDPVPVYSPATIVGWGFTDIFGTKTDILLDLEVVVITHAYCNAAVSFWLENPTPVSDSQICTLYDPMKTPSSAFMFCLWTGAKPLHGVRRNQTTITCEVIQGDSGGPVVVDGEVIGIVSIGTVETAFTPNIHTRVSSYIDWIEENVGPLPSAK